MFLSHNKFQSQKKFPSDSLSKLPKSNTIRDATTHNPRSTNVGDLDTLVSKNMIH